MVSVTYGAVTGGTVTGVTTFVNGNTLAETLTNGTNAPIDVVYEFNVTTPGTTPVCPLVPVNQTITVRVNPTPDASASGQSICSGSTSNVVLTNPNGVSGTTFSWTIGTVTGTVSGQLAGSGTVISQALSSAAGGSVQYLVTPSANGCAGTPIPVVVTVAPIPVGVSVASGVNKICSGSTLNIIPTTNVPGATFTWSGSNGSGGSGNITDAPVNATNSPVDITYTVIPTGPATTFCVGAPFTIVVTVNPNPSFTITNSTVSICSGLSPSISVNSPTTGSVIMLQSVVYGALINGVYTAGGNFASGGSLSEGNLINNTNNPIVVTYTFSITTPATSPVCPLSTTTQTTTVTVLPAPSFTVINSTTQICSGSQTNLILNTAVTGAQIRLKSVNYGSVNGALTVGSLYTDGQTIAEILTNPTNTTATVTYEFESILSGCTPSASQFITVQVKPTPVITNTSLQLQQSVCSGTTLNFLPTSSTDPGTTYTWTSNITGAFTGVTTSGSGAITETPINTTNTVGYVIYTITPHMNGCSGIPVNYVVTVSPTPSANGSDVTICSGQNALIAINAGPTNVAGTTFSWVAIPSGNVTGAISNNGSTINQILTLTDFSVGTVTYQVTPTANGCIGPIKNIVVTINPIPTVDAGIDYQVCEPVSIPVTGAIGGAATSGTWVIVSGSGTISSSVVSGTQVTATYTVAPTDVASTISLRLETNDPDLTGPCSLVSDIVLIQINRRPTVTLPADFVICEPSNLLATPINLSGIIGGSATTGLWSIISGSGVLSATTLVGLNVTSQYTIDPTDVGNVITMRLTTNDPDGSSGPCTAEFKDINITINRAAVVSAGVDLQLCEDNPSITLLGSQSGSATSVSWTGGTGIFSNSTIVQPVYSFNNPTEINSTVVLTITALDPDGTGPCTSVSDQMNLTINLLPGVVFSGLPAGSPSQMVENNTPITLTGNKVGGAFTITPATSVIGSTFVNVVDRATFDPSAVVLGSNFITYKFTDANGCTNSDTQEVFVNPVTTIDFGVAGALVNASGEFELCANLGLVKLLGFPVPADGFPPETKFTSEGANAAGMVIVNIGADYFIQTNGVVSDNYRIRYTFKNQFGGITFKEKSIRIFASPIAQFTSSNNCIISDVVFKDQSPPITTPFPTTITNWQWNFGDNDVSSLQNPSKRYASSGTYNVTLKVSTSQGCSNISAPFTLRVGDVPVVDYGWSSICNNDQTKFLDKTNPGAISVIDSYTWDFGDGFVLTGQAAGIVPNGTHGGATSGTVKDPDHQYASFGTYNAKLTVLTNDGCSNSLSQVLFILPYNTVAPVASAEYLEGFETTDGGWIAEAFNATNSTPLNIIKSENSWIWGPPQGKTITSAAGGTNVWWTGNNANTYFSNENSVVNGPCFNLTQLKRPMVALDYFSDAENNLDGAVLQYSTDGGLIWKIVGPPEGLLNRDAGINWFNGQGIFSRPGSQQVGQYGWTEKQSAWKNARFTLDMVPATERSQVRIRMAFSSNDGNASGNTFDGFAFDNFFVGEKKRNVLVEHFTTSSLKSSVDADIYLNTLLQDQITPDHRQVSDFYNIQYHTNFFGIDFLNRDNPIDPAARALYYGVSQPPYSIMDGLLIPNKFTGVTYELNKVEIDRRALVDPQFELTLDTIATNNNRTMSVQLTIKAKTAMSVPLVAHVALLEEDVIIPNVGVFKNVLRKQLFGSDGETINVPFIKDQSVIKSRLDVDINTTIVDPSKLLLVGIIQDKNSKEIYQSVVVKAPKKNGAPIVGVKDNNPVALINLNSIQIFPNPANGEFNFGIPGEVHPDTQWKIIDLRGISVLQGDFTKSFNGLLSVDVSSLSNELYYIVIDGPGGYSVRKKLMVMNRN